MTTEKQLAHRREIHAEAIAKSEARYGVWIAGGGLSGRWLLGHNPDDQSPWVAESKHEAVCEALSRDAVYRGRLKHKACDLSHPPKRSYKPRAKLSRKVITSVRLLPEQIAELKLAGSMDKGITAAMRDAARYRWLRLRYDGERAVLLDSNPDPYWAPMLSDGLDAAIDAELQRTPTEVKALPESPK